MCSKLSYNTFWRANNKGADQTVRMRRLFCTFLFVCNKVSFSYVRGGGGPLTDIVVFLKVCDPVSVFIRVKVWLHIGDLDIGLKRNT